MNLVQFFDDLDRDLKAALAEVLLLLARLAELRLPPASVFPAGYGGFPGALFGGTLFPETRNIGNDTRSEAPDDDLNPVGRR